MSEKKDPTKTFSKIKSMAMPESSISFHKDPVIDPFDDGSSKKLKLDYHTQKPAKTRQQLYNDLKREEKYLEKDIFVYAPVVDRAIAFLLDLGFLFAVYKMIIFIAPFELKLVQVFLDKYNLQFIFGNEILTKTLMAGSSVIAIFFTVIVPMAFFNNSFGKKLLGLKVRGDDKYTLTMGEAFIREIILKPISLGCVVGIITPLSNKQKKSLHDKIMKTFVIKS